MAPVKPFSNKEISFSDAFTGWFLCCTKGKRKNDKDANANANPNLSENSNSATTKTELDNDGKTVAGATVIGNGVENVKPASLDPKTDATDSAKNQDLSVNRLNTNAGESEKQAGSAAALGILTTVGETEENLFDVSDLQGHASGLNLLCGQLSISLHYDTHKERLTVTVHSAKDVPARERAGVNNSRVHLILLPARKARQKTKVRSGINPIFEERCNFKLAPVDIANSGIRFRLYGVERMSREQLIGEYMLGLAALDFEKDLAFTLNLEPRSEIITGGANTDGASLSKSESASSMHSLQYGGFPELLLGLTYNASTGRLSVEIMKASNFQNLAVNRPPDTYVKLTLMSPNGSEIGRSKTTIKRNQPNPVYNEQFMFQVVSLHLGDVTLMTSAYCKKSMNRKEMIGWFSIGQSNSGEEEGDHWAEMKEKKGEQVCRWHRLLPP